MADAKQFKTYAQQLAFLEQRDMTIEDPASAEALLRQRNYSAHHARLFNRVIDIKPRFSNDPCLLVILPRGAREVHLLRSGSDWPRAG